MCLRLVGNIWSGVIGYNSYFYWLDDGFLVIGFEVNVSMGLLIREEHTNTGKRYFWHKPISDVISYLVYLFLICYGISSFNYTRFIFSQERLIRCCVGVAKILIVSSWICIGFNKRQLKYIVTLIVMGYCLKKYIFSSNLIKKALNVQKLIHSLLPYQILFTNNATQNVGSPIKVQFYF